MINAILIEDEKPAARYLLRLLEEQDLNVMATLHSVKESVEWLQQNKAPDLIFLDIQLGDGISFEIFEQITPKSAIIFTTAYDEYALKAFKLNSIDYLLKPINKIDLQNAIQKYNNNKNPIVWESEQLKSLLINNFENKYRERFLIKIGSTLKTINTEDIACFYAKDKSTHLFTKQREYPVDLILNDLESQLPPNDFFRISRNAIVHLPFIENITMHSGSRYKIHIKNLNHELIVSRERVPNFKLWLEK